MGHYQNVYLPDEVIEEIVMHMELKELLSMRLTSKKWNTFITTHLPYSHLPIIKFYKGQEDHLTNYLLTLQTRLEEAVAFGTYQLTLGDWTKIESFLHVLGPYMVHCTLCMQDTTYGSNLFTLLEHMPNLNHFYVEGPNCDSSLFSQIPTANTKLQVLSLKICSGTLHDCSALDRWMSNLTGLIELHVDSITRFSNQAEFFALLNRYSNMKRMSLSVLFDEFEDSTSVDEYHINSNLKLHLSFAGLNGRSISALIGSLKGALRSVSFKLNELTEDIRISSEVDLEHLQISTNTDILGKFWDKNPSCRFMALKSVALTWEGIDYNLLKPHFRKVSFPTVTNLAVAGGFDASGNGVKPYHIIFPNLTTFSMKGIIFTCHIAYIYKFLPKVTELTLISTSDTSELHIALFTDGTGNQSGKFAPPRLEFVFKWAFRSLMGLKRLHIEDLTHIGKIMFGIAALTQLKQLSPMDYLKFTGNILESREQLLFHNCAHKKVVFEHKLA